MKNQTIITQPDNSANLQTPLPPDTNNPLSFPVVVQNTMTTGELNGHQFKALVDGSFNFNIRSEAEIVETYRVRLLAIDGNVVHGGHWHEHFNTAPRNSDGQADKRVFANINVTLPLRKDQVVEIYDYQDGSHNGARRWPYSDGCRIEISFEG